MKKEDVLAWIHGFEAAREVERDLARQEPVGPAGSVAIGLSLTEFARRCCGEGFGRDRARDDDVRIVRERWAKLRRAYRLWAPQLPRIGALEERREIGPESVRTLMIALIEEQDPYALDHSFETRGAEGEHD